MSIFLEAIQRLVEPQEVQNPKLVCIVGCFGLFSNILGLVLFHDHSHGGGGGGGGGHGHHHDHAHGEDEDVEQGYRGRTHSDPSIADDRGSPVSTVPENVAGAGRRASSPKPNLGHPITEPTSPLSRKRRKPESARGPRRFSTSTGRGITNVEDIYAHPATMRQDIIAAGRGAFENEQSSDSDSRDGEGPNEQSGLLRHRDRASNYTDEHDGPFKVPNNEEDIHKGHNHAQPKPKGHKGGHGHDLNMRGVFLHVMGDALGNIGVIVSALIIWLTDYTWRFYVDPGISLVITVIILASAIPLCKAASRILLQAVPPGMSIDHIKEDIEGLPGILGSHHLHVWQLSDTKIVASIHIQVDTEIKGEGSERYMNLARQVRRCLHAYGIHSSTIQPEFAPDGETEDTQNLTQASSSADANPPSRAASLQSDPQACLLECDDNCGRRGQCCPKKPT